MELNISDLLDDLQEVDIDILPYTKASENRIKELTMARIQNKPEPKRRRHPIGRIFLIAAIIALLAVPVAAVSGQWFTDWKNTSTERWPDYDSSPNIGAGSKIWDTSNWITELSAENASASGLTMVCKEFGNDPVFGTLTTTEGYWLEKWEAGTYVPMEGSYENSTPIAILDDTILRWDINWESVYGTLPSGYFRLGKIFTYENPEGNQEEFTYYVKFRIFTEEMEPYIKTAGEALDALYNQEIYHIKRTYYDVHDLIYEYYTLEIWKNGDNYLEEGRYFMADGTEWTRFGNLILDGKGYTLDWCGSTVLSGVSEWSEVDYLTPDYWHRNFTLMDTKLGEVHDQGDAIRFVQSYSTEDDSKYCQEEIDARTAIYRVWNYRYKETIYTYDTSGNVRKIDMTALYSLDPETADPVPLESLEVYDTSPEEIAKVIAAQDVGGVRVFSWEADFAEFADKANTDGFVNTTPQPISTAEEAIARAKREADPKENPKYKEGYVYNIATAYFDKAADMWKISFENSQSGIFVLYVYLDAEGVTQMMAYPYDDPILNGSFDWESVYWDIGYSAIIDGFQNANPKPVTCGQDALDIAWAEYAHMPNPMHDKGFPIDTTYGISYDIETGMWRVSLGTEKSFYVNSYIFIDSAGYVRMIYHETP